MTESRIEEKLLQACIYSADSIRMNGIEFRSIALDPQYFVIGVFYSTRKDDLMSMLVNRGIINPGEAFVLFWERPRLGIQYVSMGIDRHMTEEFIQNLGTSAEDTLRQRINFQLDRYDPSWKCPPVPKVEVVTTEDLHKWLQQAERAGRSAAILDMVTDKGIANNSLIHRTSGIKNPDDWVKVRHERYHDPLYLCQNKFRIVKEGIINRLVYDAQLMNGQWATFDMCAVLALWHPNADERKEFPCDCYVRMVRENSVDPKG